MDTEPTGALRPRAPRHLLARLGFLVKDHAPFIALGVLFSALLVALLWNRIFVVVHAGEGGVRYRLFHGGVVLDKVAEEGVKVIPPWDTLTHYNIRVQIIYHEFDVLTNQGLPVRLKIAVSFHPVFELLGVLHREVGPDYPRTIILPQIESVMRKGLGTKSPEDIYTNQDQLMTKLVTQAIEEISRRYIVVDDMLIRSVELPAEVRVAIEEKAVQQQRLLEYDYRLPRERQEAERKAIEAEGINNYFNIIGRNLDDRTLAWQGIEATLRLADSNTTKVVVVGGGHGTTSLPLILGDLASKAQTAVQGAAAPLPAAPADARGQVLPSLAPSVRRETAPAAPGERR